MVFHNTYTTCTLVMVIYVSCADSIDHTQCSSGERYKAIMALLYPLDQNSCCYGKAKNSNIAKYLDTTMTLSTGGVYNFEKLYRSDVSCLIKE